MVIPAVVSHLGIGYGHSGIAYIIHPLPSDTKFQHAPLCIQINAKLHLWQMFTALVVCELITVRGYIEDDTH